MSLSSKQKELIEKHLDLVLELNKVHNLTNITDKKQAKELHIKDSLASLDIIKDFPNKEKFVDLGSGCGYPGICLSIASDIPCDLIESINKKADCLKNIISELNINSSISVINERIEEFSNNNKNLYDFATARALSSLSSLLELAQPLLKINGFLVCYKGYDIKTELDEALKICNKLGFTLVCNQSYIVNENIKHRIVVFQKVTNSLIKLPRRNGLAQKKPLH